MMTDKRRVYLKEVRANMKPGLTETHLTPAIPAENDTAGLVAFVRQRYSLEDVGPYTTALRTALHRLCDRAEALERGRTMKLWAKLILETLRDLLAAAGLTILIVALLDQTGVL